MFLNPDEKQRTFEAPKGPWHVKARKTKAGEVLHIRHGAA